MDAQPNFDELLPAETTQRRDPYTLREHLVYDILQHAFLAGDIGSRGAGIDVFGAFRVTADDCAGESKWMWMIGVRGMVTR